MEINRTLTTVQTVPDTARITTGTFTGTSGTFNLKYGGTDNLDQILAGYTNPFLYFPTAGIIVRISQYRNNIAHPSVVLPANISEAGHILECKLVQAIITNTGATAATQNGVLLVPNVPLYLGQQQASPAGHPQYIDPVLIDPQGGSVTVTERI